MSKAIAEKDNEEPTSEKSKIGNTTEESREEKIANKQNRTMIITAGISSFTTLIVGLVAAFLSFSPFQELVKGWITPAEVKVMAIEQIPFWISTYDGTGDLDPECCAGHAGLEYGNGVSPFPEYLLDYTISDDNSRYSYAGIDFVFEQSQNFSDYRNIEFTIHFNNTINQADFKFEDIAGAIQPFRLVGNADSDKRFVVPLSNFDQIDFNAIRAISFQVDSTFAIGKNNLVVKDIILAK